MAAPVMASGFRLGCDFKSVPEDEVFFSSGRKALDDGYAILTRGDPVDDSLFFSGKEDDLMATYH